MPSQNPGSVSDQDRVVKGKSPRNALMAVGAIFAVLIGAMGFYYQSKVSAREAEQAREEKAAKTAASVDRAPAGDDIDRVIADQQARARTAEEKARRDAAASDAQSASSKPSLSLDQYEHEAHDANLAASTKEDNIYASPIFIPGLKVRDQADPQNGTAANAIVTPQQMALQQLAVQRAAAGSADAQAKEIASAMGQGNARPSSAERDLQFLKDAKAESSSTGGFPSAGFVGEEQSCTLSPPHHIPVLTVEGENSDRPGTVSLVVEQDIYDSVTGACLMIPKGTTITGPYQSDIQVGQESIEVAATEMRLPNGKEVPLYGAQGADENGYAGFSGDVNNHFWKIYGASALTAVLLGRFDSNDVSSTSSGPYGVTQVGSTAGQVAAQTSQSILSRYQSIPPTVTVPIGKRGMIKVNRDIHLEPYRG
jgi:type IV secretion system protein TrbI